MLLRLVQLNIVSLILTSFLVRLLNWQISFFLNWNLLLNLSQSILNFIYYFCLGDLKSDWNLMHDRYFMRFLNYFLRRPSWSSLFNLDNYQHTYDLSVLSAWIFLVFFFSLVGSVSPAVFIIVFLFLRIFVIMKGWSLTMNYFLLQCTGWFLR